MTTPRARSPSLVEGEAQAEAGTPQLEIKTELDNAAPAETPEDAPADAAETETPAPTPVPKTPDENRIPKRVATPGSPLKIKRTKSTDIDIDDILKDAEPKLVTP